MASPNLPPQIEPAEVKWKNGVPESVRFGDVYFSREDGLKETRYVFLQPNHLAERFAEVRPGGQFVIAETGFGTGLNFLAAWQAWNGQKPDCTATLHFISVERFPLTRDDLIHALDLWPELADLATELIENYPPLVKGAHRLVLGGGQVRLTLYFGDVLEAWQALEFNADAWFLDGFAPARNPEMWLDRAIAQVRAHSRPGSTLATFTSVGRIRRSLAAVGFKVHKTRGFGRKRDMLSGLLENTCEPMPPGGSDTIAVIGAGIAGCLLARNLADRGTPVTLVDTASHQGTAASGNRQGAMYVKLGVEFNDQTELGLTSLLFSQRFYARYRDQCWHPTGLLQLAWSAQEADRQRRFLERNAYPAEIFYPVDRDEASRLTGVQTQSGGLWFPGNGWLEPARLCKVLTDHPLITRVFNFEVGRLLPLNGKWQLSGPGGSDISAHRIVICAGHQSPALIPLNGAYRLKSIRGQVTHLPDTSLQTPKAVVCGTRYLNPSDNGIAVTGATFDLRDDNPETTPESHHENLTELQSMLPGSLSREAPLTELSEQVEGKVAFRCTTHDYQPVAGKLCDIEGNELTGVYLLTGLGSKGLTYAPLLAEYLADELSGQPACLPKRLGQRVGTRRIHKPDTLSS
ncbi:FAD-dependent cmnm(5)s(2)U34 oxidoreductase [Marinobacter salinus]|uniref:tRNA 5-methylaminomethyl-2-thiouridine biosynthesis bifunctional protein MnmC n=1 Tax=Marinobacter salinus TaxID=1874317 RepID=A0A1D9GKF6_9GAMM|nr:bifunctional tRNA (5-methylaminomethyl-2-thiouridine)(34)-methyltransferase MnmD/FAD-dependent 5-carboxymethylaminomethyl-2-thiouridine(34) oxidoreductase MnmC [Marinobacter salinus]AOY87870.1 FAD-dependent cmnm(5)s(2)U34 oxidoreductase [Marinobacter salinus]